MNIIHSCAIFFAFYQLQIHSLETREQITYMDNNVN